MDATDDHRELLALREALHWRQAREDLTYFAETIEIPATPPDEAEVDKPYPIRIKPAAHHRLILRSCQDMLTGRLVCDGVMVLAPPGSAKSSYASVVVPAWALGRRPNFNVISVSYSSELASQWGYRVRQIVKQPEYGLIFPNATVKADQSGVSRWSMMNESSYRSDGVLGSMTGFRADLLIPDDLVAGREEADSETIRNKLWNAYIADLVTRLKPNGKQLVIGTHWHEDDPMGRILGPDWKGQSGLWLGADKRNWFIINLPMVAEHHDDPIGRKIGERLWPEHYLEKEVKRLESVGGRDWASLYQQRPTPNEGSILNRTWWREWKSDDPPICDMVFLAYDTAIEAKEENDYSAMTAWGLFRASAEGPRYSDRVIKAGEEVFNVMLLGAWQERVPAVDLVRTIVGDKKDGIKGHISYWPEVMQNGLILVEKKASGHQLIQELKRLRLPVKEVEPKGAKGALGKVPRAHAVSFILESGAVWYMRGALTNKVLDECAAFPYGRHDDLVDTVLYALQYFRDAFFFHIPSDFPDHQEEYERQVQEYEDERASRGKAGYGHIRQDSNSYVPDGQRRGYGRIG